MIVIFAAATITYAQDTTKDFHFKTFIELMNFSFQGKDFSYYEKLASNAGLTKIHEEKDKSEVYYVWGENVSYKKGHMTETYTKLGDNPSCLNFDLIRNEKGLYVPMTISIIFPDAEAQERFYNEGIKMGAVVNDKIYSTDVDPTWKNVKGIKYVKHRTNTSWRYIFFYEKDGMNMCTFLF